jgi:hypothetical protein
MAAVSRSKPDGPNDSESSFRRVTEFASSGTPE